MFVKMIETNFSIKEYSLTEMPFCRYSDYFKSCSVKISDRLSFIIVATKYIAWNYMRM